MTPPRPSEGDQTFDRGFEFWVGVPLSRRGDFFVSPHGSPGDRNHIERLGRDYVFKTMDIVDFGQPMPSCRTNVFGIV